MTTKDEALRVERALKLALEALEKYCTPYRDGTHPADEAITAIRAALASKSEALAESALERMAENERELGLDYMQPAQQRYTTARNAWTGRATYKCNHCGREDFRSEHSAMFHLCKPAPEQSEQQQHAPVAWGKNQFIENDDGVPIGTDEPELAYGNTPPDDEGWWPLYTSPPANANAGKSWAGLTFAEICECENDYLHIFARAIEAKLREKNA